MAYKMVKKMVGGRLVKAKKKVSGPINMKRSQAAKRSATKRRSKMSSITKKRNKTMARRKQMGG